jgi:hypothetical protein
MSQSAVDPWRQTRYLRQVGSSVLWLGQDSFHREAGDQPSTNSSPDGYPTVAGSKMDGES